MAMSANSAFCLAAIILALFMRIVLLRANKRLARGETAVTQEMKGEKSSWDRGSGTGRASCT